MCIRDSGGGAGSSGLPGRGHLSVLFTGEVVGLAGAVGESCLLYTSDAADDPLCVDPGGRRIIKKKKQQKKTQKKQFY